MACLLEVIFFIKSVISLLSINDTYLIAATVSGGLIKIDLHTNTHQKICSIDKYFLDNRALILLKNYIICKKDNNHFYKININEDMSSNIIEIPSGTINLIKKIDEIYCFISAKNACFLFNIQTDTLTPLIMNNCSNIVI